MGLTKGADVRRMLTAVSVTVVVTVAGCGGTAPTSSSSPLTQASASSPATGSKSSTTSSAAATSAVGSPTSFAYVPLWPFASVGAASQWQRGAGAGGHQPWHLDAALVAVAFARQYLHFTEIDHVVRKTVTAQDAHVSVGSSIQGNTGTAAVVHLVRIGSGTGRPWEVVGTDDTSGFTVTQPRYGSSVKGTITVGGHIAGVDESIRVTARQLVGAVGGYCCRPAGASAPWSVRLTLRRPQPGPVTIVASTGGHIAAVERFAITGVRSG